MRVLVTGGAGFIGSHLADALVAAGDDVVVLDDLRTGRRENVPAGARFVEGSLTDDGAVRAAVDGAEVVYHQGALGSVPRSVADPLTTDAVNAGGTLRVLVAARDAGVRRVVMASSSSVYGGLAPMPTVETSPLVPRSPYAVSKIAAEQYARVWAELFDIETVVLRYFNVFGPRQREDSEYAAVIPRFTAALLAGRRPVVHGDGLQSRDFTFVGDVVAANRAAGAAAASGVAVNVAGGSPRTILDVLGAIAGALGTEAVPEHVEARPGDVRDSWADIAAARDLLGWTPSTPFEEGITRTVDWFRDRST